MSHRALCVTKVSVYLTTTGRSHVCLGCGETARPMDGMLFSRRKGSMGQSVAPLSVRETHVLVESPGDFDNIPGMRKSLVRPGENNRGVFTALPHPGQWRRRHWRQMWITRTYRSGFEFGIRRETGNPTPGLAAQTRPGDNPLACSVVA